MRWLVPPPAATAAFSSARSPGVVLRVSRTRAPLPSTARTKRAVSVATPDRCPSRLSAVRSPASSARAGPETRAAATGTSSLHSALDHDRVEGAGARLPESLGGGLEAEQHTRLLLHDRGASGRVLVDDGLRGDVAGPHVLGEGAGDDLTNLVSSRFHT